MTIPTHGNITALAFPLGLWPVSSLPTTRTVTPTVTPLNIFIALIPIVLSCVLPPLGRPIGFTRTFSFLFCIVPFTNFIHTTFLLWDIGSALWGGRSTKAVVAAHYTHTIDCRARALLSIFTVVRFAKLNAYTGIQFTLLFCTTYFLSWVILEVVFLAWCLCWRASDLPTKTAVHREPDDDGARTFIRFLLQSLCVLLVPAVLYLGDIATCCSVVRWYLYIAVEWPCTLTQKFYHAWFDPVDGMNDILASLRFTVAIVLVIACNIVLLMWWAGTLLGPLVAVGIGWKHWSADSRGRVTARAQMLWRILRDWEWGVGVGVGVGVGIVLFVWWWWVNVFESEGTGKEGWCVSWY